MRERTIRLLLGALGRLPLPLNHLVGGLLGRLAWWFAREARRITLINLERCFPDQTAAWHRRVAQASLVESAKAFTETPRLWRLPGEEIQRLVREIEGAEVLEAALHSPTGAIFASPHLGCWELMGLYLPGHTRLTSLYRPPRVAAIDAPMRRGREHTGASLVPTDASGVKALKKALHAGECIGILPDQSPKGAKGVYAPFFGIPAFTMVLLNRLAAQHDAFVALCFAERLPRGRGYRLHFAKASAAVGDADLVTAAAALNAGVEALIRRRPEQYAWSYKRFKRQPEGHQRFYR